MTARPIPFGVRYGRLRLDGDLDEFHRALAYLQADTCQGGRSGPRRRRPVPPARRARRAATAAERRRVVKLPGRVWRIIFRLQNAWWDGRAILAGYCNHCPNNGTPGQSGGYLFWRCALRRGHQGLHRSRNYVWTDDGVTSYLPVRPRQAMPDQPWSRSAGAMTRRQRRNRDAWHRQRDAERAATRPAGGGS